MSNNIYVLVGDEIEQKNERIHQIKKQIENFNYNKIIVDSSTNDLKKTYIKECFMFLSTVDMFNLDKKILHVVVDNSKVIVDLLNEMMEYLYDSVLVVDLRSSDMKSLTSSNIYKKNKSKLVIEKFTKLEEKNREKTILSILDMFKENNINFVSKEDELFFANALYDNSGYSYSYIKQQIKQIKTLSLPFISKEDVNELMVLSFNDNYYALINKMFKCENKIELINLIEANLLMFEKSNYIAFLNTFTYVLKDYIRYSNGAKCRNGANFYQFKNSNLRIVYPNKFFVELSNLSLQCRISYISVKEELILLIIDYFK